MAETTTFSEEPPPFSSTPLEKTTPHTSFTLPSRKIISKEDLTLFLESETCRSFREFIQHLSFSIKGFKLSHPVHLSEVSTSLLDLLESIDQVVTSTPPEINPNSRFGNPAFRLFYDRVQRTISEKLNSWIPNKAAIPELSKYLEHCFGDRQRIDYGTGHEAHFLCFLYCLHQLSLYSIQDYPAVVLRIFARYIQLMRRIQSTYWLEPAGSHGVWGLDDYHSLPFLFGASQLIDHPYLKPKSIHDSDLVDENALDYLYFQCIQHLRDTSSVSLRWHAPVLDDISAVKTWFKIEKGLHLLYFKEVLSKLPVMQHFLFGSLIPFSNPRLDQLSLLTTDPLHSMDAHVHVYAMGQEFPTCCGMRIPSIHAVLGAQTKAKANSTLKTLPFD